MVSSKRVVLGTRGSVLARWQAGSVAEALRAAHPGLVVEELVIVTEGDRISSGPLWNAGGKGLWVNAIEDALVKGTIDLAVHSMKDLPGELAQGLVLAAVPERADVRDAVVSRTGVGLSGLPEGARVGTTSLRRSCQVKAMRPDLVIETLRGNLDTRLRKVDEGVVDAAILACAGLDRLRLSVRITERLPVDRMLPAAGQGALAVEARGDDASTRAICRPLDHSPTATAVAAERSFLAKLGASCRTPVAGYARWVGDRLVLAGLVGQPDGTGIVASEIEGDPSDAIALGHTLAERLLAQGAATILGGLR